MLPEAVGNLCQAGPTPGEIPTVREAKKRNVETSGAKRPYGKLHFFPHTSIRQVLLCTFSSSGPAYLTQKI